MKILRITLFLLFFILLFSNVASAKEKIHFITTPVMGTDAIILESDGKFAMIDTGEDNDFPDGSNPKYPLREGVITNKKNSITDRVFAHLEKLGVKELEFIIITHTHSDHIGNASEIIKKIPTKKIYLKEYSDDRIYEKDRLWDNLYGYDKTLKSANENNVIIIQNITSELAKIKLNNIEIELFNYENEYKDGKLSAVWDDNVNSIVSLLKSHNKKIFLGGDLDNTDGREDKYSKIIGTVDIMKLNHHVDTKLSNNKNFIESLNPKNIVKTSPDDIEINYKKWLDHKGINIIDTGRNDLSAVVLEVTDYEIKDVSADYGKYGVIKENDKLKFNLWNEEFAANGWLKNNGVWYYIKDNGELHKGWIKENDDWYYLDDHGVMVKNTDYKIGNEFYYFNKDGYMETLTYKNGYLYGRNGRRINDFYIGKYVLIVIFIFISAVLICFIIKLIKTFKINRSEIFKNSK